MTANNKTAITMEPMIRYSCILNESGQPIFRGINNDVNVVRSLEDNEALTATGSNVEHWESCFEEGRYSGRFFSFRVEMIRESGAVVGRAVGIIE